MLLLLQAAFSVRHLVRVAHLHSTRRNALAMLHPDLHVAMHRLLLHALSSRIVRERRIARHAQAIAPWTCAAKRARVEHEVRARAARVKVAQRHLSEVVRDVRVRRRQVNDA